MPKQLDQMNITNPAVSEEIPNTTNQDNMASKRTSVEPKNNEVTRYRNACICHALAICDQNVDQGQDEPAPEQFESIDLDKDVEENDWTILFPDTTVIEIQIRHPPFPQHGTSSRSTSPCERCGWMAKLAEKSPTKKLS